MPPRTSSSSRSGSASWHTTCSGSSRSRYPPGTSRWRRTPLRWAIFSIAWPGASPPASAGQVEGLVDAGHAQHLSHLFARPSEREPVGVRRRGGVRVEQQPDAGRVDELELAQVEDDRPAAVALHRREDRLARLVDVAHVHLADQPDQVSVRGLLLLYTESRLE